ncbi:MAG: polyprenol monophosphomannose synthase [Desulfurococcaceae archaeon]
MSKCIGIVIPTYNEKDNIIPLIKSIFETLSNIGLKHYVIVVDDNSPDGTANIVREYFKTIDNVEVIVRPGKMGLGSAILTGLQKILDKECITHIITMDADFSHDPRDLKIMLSDLNKADIIIGSRYVENGEIIGWSFKRRLISIIANNIVKILYRTGLKDHTSNYRVYSRRAIEYILKYSTTSSYEWVVESLLICKALGLKIVEKPVRFVDRKKGSSKLSLRDIVKWFLFILKYRLKYSMLKKKTL